MRVRDPVCGMTLTAAGAASRARHDGLVLYFCTEGCARRFREDPLRYLESGGAPPAREGLIVRQRPCPACGEPARADQGMPALPAELSLEELEILVRNEWRRRLGSRRYSANHSRALVRWTVVAALRPEDGAAARAAELAAAAERVREREQPDYDPDRELEQLTAAVQAVLGQSVQSRVIGGEGTGSP